MENKLLRDYFSAVHREVGRLNVKYYVIHLPGGLLHIYHVCVLWGIQKRLAMTLSAA